MNQVERFVDALRPRAAPPARHRPAVARHGRRAAAAPVADATAAPLGAPRETAASVGRHAAPRPPRRSVRRHDRPVAVRALRHAPRAARRAQGGGQGGGRQAQRRVRRRRRRRPAPLPRSARLAGRRAAHDDADQRPQRRRPPTSPATSSRRPASRSRSPSTTRSSACAPIRDLVAEQRGRAGARPHRAAGRPAQPAAHVGVDRPVRLDAQGASTSSPATCPACPIPVFLAGARMEAQFAFGPMTGAAANVTLLQLPRRAPHRRQHRPGGRPRPRRLRRLPRARASTRSCKAWRVQPVSVGRPCDADVVVVGGGPAGAAAAITLARPGATSCSSTRPTFPRDKCCGDGLTTGALRLLEELGLDPATVRVVAAGRRRRRALAVRPRRSRFPLPRGQGTFAAVARRADLDAALARPGPRPPAPRSSTATRCRRRRRRTTARVTVDGRRRRHGRTPATSSAPTACGRRCASCSAPADARLPRRVARVPPVLRRRRPGGRSDLFVWFEPDLLPGYAWSFPLPDGRRQRRLRHPPRRRQGRASPGHEGALARAPGRARTSRAVLGPDAGPRHRTRRGPSRPRSTTSPLSRAVGCSSPATPPPPPTR